MKKQGIVYTMVLLIVAAMVGAAELLGENEIIFLIIPKRHPITITKRSPYPFGKDGLDEKKRQSFDCLLVREAGLEPARP